MVLRSQPQQTASDHASSVTYKRLPNGCFPRFPLPYRRVLGGVSAAAASVSARSSLRYEIGDKTHAAAMGQSISTVVVMRQYEAKYTVGVASSSSSECFMISNGGMQLLLGE